MQKRRRTPNWPFAMAFVVAGLVPAWFGISGIGEALSLHTQGERIIGLIDRFDCPRRSTSCDVIVTFVAPDGQSRQMVERNASPAPDFVAGGRTEVLFLQQGEHEVMRLNRSAYLWGLPILLTLLSTPFMCVGAYLVFMSLRQRR